MTETIQTQTLDADIDTSPVPLPPLVRAVSIYPLPMQEDIARLMETMRQPNLIDTPGALPLDRVALRVSLIREEGINELRTALRNSDSVEIIDSLTDTIYVGLGALVEMGQCASADLLEQLMRRNQDALGLFDGAEQYLIDNLIDVDMLEEALRAENVGLSTVLLTTIVANAITTLIRAGLDPKPFFDEVHRANLSKLDENNEPILSRGEALDNAPRGKFLKGPNYSPPDIAGVYARYCAR